MKNIINGLTLFFLIGCSSYVAYGKDANAFPWLITPYKYDDLTVEQKQIYQNAFFETTYFFLYNHTDPNNVKAIKHLNSWTNCVLQTKGSKKWSPRYHWVFGEDLDKSAAYVLYNFIAPIVCENYSDNAKTQISVLRLYNYGEWDKWSIKNKEVYLSGYIDTAATFFMRLSSSGMNKDLQDLQNVIESIGINGILSDTVKIKFERQYPLPWSISRGLGSARKRALSK